MKKSKGFFESLLFLVCLFPYISPISTPFDTQPFALGFAIFLLIVMLVQNKDLDIPITLTPYFIVFAIAFVMMLIHSNFSDGVRSLVGYASVAILSLAGYYSFKYVKGRYLLFSANIWLIFGLIQTFVSKNFGSFMLSRLSTSADRGVTSLSVEPSSYAIMCIFFLVFNDVFYSRGDYGKRTYNYIFVISIMQILLSKAALGLMLLVLYLVIKMFTSGNVWSKFKGFVAFVFLGSLFYYCYNTFRFLQEGRIGSLLFKLEDGVMNLILNDGSVADRLSHILVSFSSLFHSYGLGYGLGTWDEHALRISVSSGDFVARVTSVNFTPGRIMSGWGSAVFELGAVGVIFIMSFFFIMRSGIKRTNGQMRSVYKSSMLTIFIVMLMAIPLSFPLFGFLIGSMLQLQTRESLEKAKNNIEKKRIYKKYKLVW